MSTKDLFENGDRPQSRREQQHRNDLAIPDCGQWIRAAPLAAFAAARKAGIVLEPVAACRAEPGFHLQVEYPGPYGD